MRAPPGGCAWPVRARECPPQWLRSESCSGRLSGAVHRGTHGARGADGTGDRAPRSTSMRVRNRAQGLVYSTGRRDSTDSSVMSFRIAESVIARGV